MLTKVSKQMLAGLIKKEHNSWCEEYVTSTAEKYIADLDERFDLPLYTYITSGKKTDLKEGEFSLSIIERLNRGATYLQCIVYLDGYIKDPEQGRLTILRR